MAQIRLGIGQVNITNTLIAVARKTTTPLVIEAQESYAPPHPATRNVVVPAVGDIDPVIYYVDFYESANGTSFDLLLIQLVYDLKNKIIISERRFYVVGGPGANDPAPDQTILTDPYLDGKTISGVFKEGFRYLRPNTETIPEWQPYTGGGIELLTGLTFSGGEIVSIEISYQADQTQSSTGGGFYNGVELIDLDITLDVTHRKKRLRCEAGISRVLAIEMESISVVADGTFYHFTTNGGLNYQTRIIPFSGEVIKYNGENYTEISIGQGEFVRIVKVGTFWEAELVHPFVLQVGERFPAGWNNHPSCKPEDGQLYDGDEWPRVWWWLNNKLPGTHCIIDDTVINLGYTHPVGKEGLFVKHSTLKKFRTPNTQNLSERGLKNFNTYGGDGERVYDFPGGLQHEMIGPHVHPLPSDASGAANIQSLVHSANADEGFNAGNLTDYNVGGAENRVKNIGVIYMRRF